MQGVAPDYLSNPEQWEIFMDEWIEYPSLIQTFRVQYLAEEDLFHKFSSVQAGGSGGMNSSMPSKLELTGDGRGKAVPGASVLL